MLNLHGKVVDEGEGAILSFKKKKKQVGRQSFIHFYISWVV